MRKCIIMFVLLVIAMAIASMVENQMEIVPSNEYTLDGDNSGGLLANANTKN